MTQADDNGPERASDDILAAEYVLGVLAAEERRAAAERIEREPAFARLVDGWEANLSPMADAYRPVDPPASVKAALDRRLFAGAAAGAAISRQPAASSPGLWSSLAFWRGLTAAALAAFALAIVLPLAVGPAETPELRLVASLAGEGTDVRYLALYDAEQGAVSMSHVSGDRASDRDFELWMIEGQNPPVSMGVIPSGATIHITIDEATRLKLARGAVLAISVEPPGGSPTGQPTGPVVATGDLRSI
jgi:anti-sigma-K factor RskA